jgi:hypothetical protein
MDAAVHRLVLAKHHVHDSKANVSRAPEFLMRFGSHIGWAGLVAGADDA